MQVFEKISSQSWRQIGFRSQRITSILNSYVFRPYSSPLMSITSTLNSYMNRTYSSPSISFDGNTTSDDRVLVHDLGSGIRHVELNRPEKLNSLDMEMFHGIAKCIKDLRCGRYGNDIRVVILSGRGRAFCTGLDVSSIMKPNANYGRLPTSKIEDLLKRPSGYGRKINMNGSRRDAHHPERNVEDNEKDLQAAGNLAQDIAYLWRGLRFPVIAVLNGMCFGGGLQLALGADMRYATQDCQLSIMEVKWGLIPDMSASLTLRELIPIDMAKELTYTGKIIEGTHAEKIGLITRCSEDPMKEALEIATMIASKSPDAINAAKTLYQTTWVNKTEKDCLEFETALQKRLLPSWNQTAASLKNFGIKVPFKITKR